MLRVKDLNVDYQSKKIIKGLTLEVDFSSIVTVLGNNGSGKSTFLKIVAGKMDPTSGNVHLEPGKRMSVLEQNHNKHNEDTVLDTILKGNKPLKK